MGHITAPVSSNAVQSHTVSHTQWPRREVCSDSQAYTGQSQSGKQRPYLSLLEFHDMPVGRQPDSPAELLMSQRLRSIHPATAKHL